MNETDVLKQCTVENNVIKLPSEQLERSMYLKVKKALELIGGKWKGGKVQGFVFNEDPTELLKQISGGTKRNIKKEFQFFATPDPLADKLVELADIQPEDIILEPSAGQGSIVNAIHRIVHEARTVWGFELMPANQIFLNKIAGFRLLGNDFLKECDTKFDKIISNPPFSKNQDITHIKKMYECLNDGGTLVSIASTHWKNSTNKKEMTFKKWLEEIGAKIYYINKGQFKASGTMVGAVIIVINKPKAPFANM